jgi:hypothetical protein
VAVREALLPGNSVDQLFEADLHTLIASAKKAVLPEQPSEATPKAGGSEGRR